MKIKNIFFVLLASITFYSCEDFFDSVTDIEVQEHEPRLVIYSFLDPTSNFQTLHAGNSKGYTDGQNPDDILDATISLSKNGAVLGTFEHSVEGYYIFNSDINSTEGDEFRLDVSAPGYESIFATTIATPEITVSGIENKGEVFSQEYGEPLPEYEVTIVDDPNEDNFYAIEVFLIDTVQQYSNHSYLTSNDVNISEWYDVGLVLSDKTFNGNTYKAQVLIDTYDDLFPNQVYEFNIKSITEEMYQYAKSYTNYQYSFDNPFAEPVTVTTNMQEDGYGIFTFIRDKKIIVTE